MKTAIQFVATVAMLAILSPLILVDWYMQRCCEQDGAR